MTSNQHRRRRSGNSLFKQFTKTLRRNLRWQYVLTAAIILTIVSALSVWVLVSDASAQLKNAQDGLNRVINSVSATSGTQLTLSDFNRLEASVREMAQRVETARGRIGVFGFIMNLNPDWKASAASLEIAHELCNAALDMLTGLEPAVNFMVGGDENEALTTGISSGERLAEVLDLGQGRFSSAQNALRLAEAELNEIDISNVSPELLLRIEDLWNYHGQLLAFDTALLNSSAILTNIMGLDEERTYLVLAQNNDEIRPSGGYISTYGWFTVNGGRLTDFDYHATTATSPNPPDAGFMNNFEVPDWWIRYGEPIYAAWDGSWYADFPTTAQLSMDYYNAGGNPHAPVDGVLAIDISGFQLILGAIGEVSVPEYGVTFNADNFRDVVYDIRAYGRQGSEPHKTFIATVYRSIFTQWRNLEEERTPALFGALLEAIQSRHLMIYFGNEDLNNVLGQLGWNGAQITGTGHDYILVADANLGNKSNNSVIRSFTYDVQINPDATVSSRLSLNYEYFAAVANNDPAVNAEYHGPLVYNNLMQVFLPLGAQLAEANGIEMEAIPDENHSHFVGQSSVQYDSSQRYQFQYQTPDLIDDFGNYHRYRLLIQKQAGARQENGNIQISLPPDAVLVSSNPLPDADYSLDQVILDYRIELDSDFWLEIVYQD